VDGRDKRSHDDFDDVILVTRTCHSVAKANECA